MPIFKSGHLKRSIFINHEKKAIFFKFLGTKCDINQSMNKRPS